MTVSFQMVFENSLVAPLPKLQASRKLIHLGIIIASRKPQRSEICKMTLSRVYELEPNLTERHEIPDGMPSMGAD